MQIALLRQKRTEQRSGIGAAQAAFRFRKDLCGIFIGNPFGIVRPALHISAVGEQLANWQRLRVADKGGIDGLVEMTGKALMGECWVKLNSGRGRGTVDADRILHQSIDRRDHIKGGTGICLEPGVHILNVALNRLGG